MTPHSTTALQHLRSPIQQPIWLPALFSLVVHGIALLLLFGAINWHPPKPETFSVSLVDAAVVPPPVSLPLEPKMPLAPPVKTIAPIPAPPKQTETKAPAANKVDIPVPAPRKPTEAKVPAEQLKPKSASDSKPLPSLDNAYDKLLNSQLADESRNISEAKIQNLLKTRARQEALDIYKARITDKIYANIRRPDNLQGDPQIQVDVIQQPTGVILSVTITRSSGIPILDRAIEQAIWKSTPLPQPDDPSLFQRDLTLIFNPLRERK